MTPTYLDGTIDISLPALRAGDAFDGRRYDFRDIFGQGKTIYFLDQRVRRGGENGGSQLVNQGGMLLQGRV